MILSLVSVSGNPAQWRLAMKQPKYKEKKCICGKLRYESRSEAETALDAVRRKRRRQGSDKKESVIYNCRIAGYYHLSSHDGKMEKVKSLTPVSGTDIYFAHFYETKPQIIRYNSNEYF